MDVLPVELADRVEGSAAAGDDEAETDGEVDEVAVSEGPWVLVASASGLGKRVPVDQFRLQKRAGMGLRCMKFRRDGDVLVVSKAQLVVRNVQLKSATAVCSDDDDDETTGKSSSSSSYSSSSSSSGRDDDDDDDDDDCAEIRVGPYLVDVPVNGADAARVAVAVPAGTYSSIRLWLYKVSSGDSADVAFRQTNPDFRDISVRLTGTFNGTPFTFTNNVNAKLTVPLTAPLVIGTGGDNVTVTIDLGTWFLRPSGGLYSPAAANTPGQARTQVQNNIRNAFRAFRDDDKDGRED
jgi:hypothetical protein